MQRFASLFIGFNRSLPLLNLMIASPHCNFLYLDIVEKVRDGCIPSFRPLLDTYTLGEDMSNLMQKCWLEDPVERPNFTYAKKTIEKMNR